MKLNLRGVLVFIVVLIIVLSSGISGSVEGAEDHLWTVIVAVIAIALATGYLANRTGDVPNTK